MSTTAAVRPDAKTGSQMLDAYRRLTRLPFGRHIYSRLVCFKAPYFGSVRPTFEVLEPGRGEVRAPNRRAVRNHLGSVHAIALCNIAELAAGSTLDASLPPTHRWIPKGMTVQYLAKATSDIRAVATVSDLSGLAGDEAREVIVPVDVLDANGTVVLHADISMWVSPRRAA